MDVNLWWTYRYIQMFSGKFSRVHICAYVRRSIFSEYHRIICICISLIPFVAIRESAAYRWGCASPRSRCKAQPHRSARADWGSSMPKTSGCTRDEASQRHASADLVQLSRRSVRCAFVAVSFSILDSRFHNSRPSTLSSSSSLNQNPDFRRASFRSAEYSSKLGISTLT